MMECFLNFKRHFLETLLMAGKIMRAYFISNEILIVVLQLELQNLLQWTHLTLKTRKWNLEKKTWTCFRAIKIKDWKMQICQINVLNNKINDIIYVNASKLHEYCNKFDEKS